MHQIKYLFYATVLALTVASCIKPFNPEIKPADAKKYVVSGQVTNENALQTVNVSITSPIDAPQYLPVNGCIVKIIDNKKNEYLMADEGNGDYTTWIDPDLIVPGISYKVEVQTPAGDIIVSEYDLVSSAPSVDSVYYIREDIEGNIPGDFTLGIQFYIDLNGSETDSRFYLWKVFETYESHVEYVKEWYYDGTVHHIVPPDSSTKVCWASRLVPEIFTLTTNNLTANEYKLNPLHYVDNKTQRLLYVYSLLIKQFALSEEAFIFWDQMRSNSKQEGGLYESQPLAIKGNLVNTTHPQNEVLGFFYAATVTEKRIFVQDVPDLSLDYYTFCSPAILRKGLIELVPRDFPAYLMGDAETWWPVWLNNECVDCTILGGVTTKPDFWPY